MEKRKAHYDLNKIKELLNNEKTRRITRTSKIGAVALGYMDDEDMVSVIAKLNWQHFYKSMTTETNSKLWQDVYKITIDKKLYIKLQISFDNSKAVIIQFKEDEGGY